MSDLGICVATCCWSGWRECMASWRQHANNINRRYVIANTDIMSAYQECLQSSTEPILAFLHDDLMIYEQGWDSRVLNCFNDPDVGVCGFGGALGHGASNLYTSPYHLPNLARQHFMSNMRSAERHGQRFTGERDVAILDGFALFVRRDIFTNKNITWNRQATYFMYSEWLCCEARRQGYRIRLVGVDCEHLGGRSSGFIPSDENYEEAHRYFYENNRDVMPYRVKE